MELVEVPNMTLKDQMTAITQRIRDGDEGILPPLSTSLHGLPLFV